MNATVYKHHPGVVMIAEESTAWPGVTRPTARGRARLRLQVEHGLDARHPALHLEGADLPAVPPPPADVRHRRTPGARTTCCRSATTRWCTARARWPARCPATRGSSWPTSGRCSAYMWAFTRQAAAVHGLRAGRRAGVERGARPRLVPARTTRARGGVQRLVDDLNRVYRDTPALWTQDTDAGRVPLDRRRGLASTTRSRSSGSRPDGDDAGLRRRTSPRRRTRTTGSACPGPARWTEVINTDADHYGGSGRGQPGRGARRGRAVARAATPRWPSGSPRWAPSGSATSPDPDQHPDHPYEAWSALRPNAPLQAQPDDPHDRCPSVSHSVEEPVEQVVGPFALDEGLLAQPPLPGEAEPLQQRRGPLVPGVALAGDLVQPLEAEQAVEDGVHGLGGVPLP